MESQQTKSDLDKCILERLANFNKEDKLKTNPVIDVLKDNFVTSLKIRKI